MELINNSSSATPEINYNTTSATYSNWFGRHMTKMEVMKRKIFKPIRKIFTNENKMRLIDDPSVVKDCHTQYNNALKDSSNEEEIDNCFMRLTYTLVHSMEVDDVIRGIQLLEADLSTNDDNSNKERIADKHYHLGLGSYRCEEYYTSVEHLKMCIENSPNHKKASTLLKKVQDHIRRGFIMNKSKPKTQEPQQETLNKRVPVPETDTESSNIRYLGITRSSERFTEEYLRRLDNIDEDDISPRLKQCFMKVREVAKELVKASKSGK